MKTSQYVGVTRDKRAYSGHGAWRAKIGVDGRSIHVGYFLIEEDAHESYLIAKGIVKKWREGGCKEDWWWLNDEIRRCCAPLQDENHRQLIRLQPDRPLTEFGRFLMDHLSSNDVVAEWFER